MLPILVINKFGKVFTYLSPLLVTYFSICTMKLSKLLRSDQALASCSKLLSPTSHTYWLTFQFFGLLLLFLKVKN